LHFWEKGKVKKDMATNNCNALKRKPREVPDTKFGFDPLGGKGKQESRTEGSSRVKSFLRKTRGAFWSLF